MTRKLILALFLAMFAINFVEAKTSETVISKPVFSASASQKCRIDSFTTSAGNAWGWKIYDYTLNVSWCYDGKKAWVTGQNAYAQVKMPFVSYKGTNYATLGNNTKYVQLTAMGTIHSSVGIPTPWGVIGGTREAHPIIKFTGYYYGNYSFSQSPF